MFLIIGQPIRLPLLLHLLTAEIGTERSFAHDLAGNLTGVTFLEEATAAKRLELLHEIAPNAVHIGLLVNPNVPINCDTSGAVTQYPRDIGTNSCWTPVRS